MLENIIILPVDQQAALVGELQREVSSWSGRDLCSVMTWIKEGAEIIPNNSAGDVCRKIQQLTIAELQSFFINWIEGTFNYDEVCPAEQSLWPKVIIGFAVGVSAINLGMLLLMKSGYKDLDYYHNGRKQRIAVKYKTDKIDTQANINSVSPNLVHSLDSAHLYIFADKWLKETSRNLMCCHDAFGTTVDQVYNLHREMLKIINDIELDKQDPLLKLEYEGLSIDWVDLGVQQDKKVGVVKEIVKTRTPVLKQIGDRLTWNNTKPLHIVLNQPMTNDLIINEKWSEYYQRNKNPVQYKNRLTMEFKDIEKCDMPRRGLVNILINNNQYYQIHHGELNPSDLIKKIERFLNTPMSELLKDKIRLLNSKEEYMEMTESETITIAEIMASTQE